MASFGFTYVWLPEVTKNAFEKKTDVNIYAYNDIHKIKVAINVEVKMTMREDTMERRWRG